MAKTTRTSLSDGVSRTATQFFRIDKVDPRRNPVSKFVRRASFDKKEFKRNVAGSGLCPAIYGTDLCRRCKIIGERRTQRRAVGG